jgi:hypothetical protein
MQPLNGLTSYCNSVLPGIAGEQRYEVKTNGDAFRQLPRDARYPGGSLLKGKPVFDYNMLILAQYRRVGPDALTPGKHTTARHRQGRYRCAEG